MNWLIFVIVALVLISNSSILWQLWGCKSNILLQRMKSTFMCGKTSETSSNLSALTDSAVVPDNSRAEGKTRALRLPFVLRVCCVRSEGPGSSIWRRKSVRAAEGVVQGQTRPCGDLKPGVSSCHMVVI